MSKQAFGRLAFRQCKKYSLTYLGLIIPVHAFASVLFQQENGEDNVGDMNGSKEPLMSVAIDSKEPTDNSGKEEDAEQYSKDVTDNANEGDKKFEEGTENEEISTEPQRPSKIVMAVTSNFHTLFIKFLSVICRIIIRFLCWDDVCQRLAKHFLFFISEI